jgi:protoheme IX farnesyltransferase
MMDATQLADVEPMPLKQAKVGLSDYLELVKFRLNSLVLMTTFVGYYLAERDGLDLLRFFHTLLGTILLASGASALNQYMERLRDARMRRTMERPLPAGRIEPKVALLVGISCGLLGASLLATQVNLLTSVLGVCSFFIYVALYTPMKVRSVYNTFVGAICGALPPMMGWTAVRGEVGQEAWLLFAVLFLWQHPHFFALAWKYREDYARGGYRMLPSEDASGARTGRMMVIFSAALLPVTWALSAIGLVGTFFLVGGLLLGVAFLLASIAFWKERTDEAARRVFLTSLLYLPAILALLVLDKVA